MFCYKNGIFNKSREMLCRLMERKPPVFRMFPLSCEHFYFYLSKLQIFLRIFKKGLRRFRGS